LKDELRVRRLTEQVNGVTELRGLSIAGRQTYLEIPMTGSEPVGSLFFRMWVDNRAQLPLIRDRLAAETHRKAEITVLKTFEGNPVNRFDTARADLPEDGSIRASSTVIAVYEDFLKHRFPDLKPEEDGTTREKQYARYYSADHLLRDITRIAITVNGDERDRLVGEFAAFGYAIQAVGNGRSPRGQTLRWTWSPRPQALRGS